MNPDEALLVFIDEYSRMADAYDARVAPRFAPFADRLVARANLRPHSTILDVSTGSGLTALLAAKAIGGTGLVVGIDLADGALAVAQTKAARLGLRNLRFEMLDSRNIVYRGATFDAALCSFGLSSVGHEQTLREVHRVLKDGASFHLLAWGRRHRSEEVWNEALRAHRTSAPSSSLARTREARATVDSVVASASLTDPAVVTAKLRGAGFSESRAEPYEADVEFLSVQDYVDFQTAWGDTEREMAEMDEANRAAFREDLEAKLEPYRHGRSLRVPWSVVYHDAQR